MALIDYENRFSDSQDIGTQAAGSVASTNIIDITNVGDATDELYVVVQIEEGVTSGGAATVKFEFETDDNAGFASATTIFDSGAVPKATLVKGYKVFRHRIPVNALEQFCRINVTVAVATLTAGIFHAYLVKDEGMHSTE